MNQNPDTGIITFFSHIIGGLEVLPPGANEDVESDWRYVKPQPGCAVISIYLGDALAQRCIRECDVFMFIPPTVSNFTGFSRST